MKVRYYMERNTACAEVAEQRPKMSLHGVPETLEKLLTNSLTPNRKYVFLDFSIVSYHVRMRLPEH